MKGGFDSFVNVIEDFINKYILWDGNSENLATILEGLVDIGDMIRVDKQKEIESIKEALVQLGETRVLANIDELIKTIKDTQGKGFNVVI
jgi:hypothetical protein